MAGRRVSGYHQHRMMGKPEQVHRLAADRFGVARLNGAFERGIEDMTDQPADFIVNQPGKFAIVEVARQHQAKALGLMLIGHRLHLLEMADHFPDQNHQRFGGGLKFEQAMQFGIGRTFLG